MSRVGGVRGTWLLFVVLTACAGPYDVRLHTPGGEYAVSEVREFTVELGSTGLEALLVFNGAQGEATLEAVTKEAGDPVRALPWLDEADPLFDLGEVDLRPLGSLEQRPVSVTYDPPATTVELEHESRLAFHYRVGGKTTRLEATLRGRALNFTCGLATTLDFLGVEVGKTEAREYVFTNTRAVADTASFSPPDAPEFTLPAGLGEDLPLAPGAEARVTVRFSPDTLGTAEARVRTRRSTLCPARTVVLRGTGVPRVLSLQAPTPMRAPVGGRVVQLLMLENQSGRPRHFRASVTAEGFSVVGGPELDVPAAAREGEVLRAGQLPVLLEFAPTRAGTFPGELRLETGVPEETLVVALTGESA